MTPDATPDTTIDVTQREPAAVSHTHYCTVGDVTVDASAAIAPGVVLQALPGSRITIGRGACLAGGVCIQSKGGVLTISAGATLGANVLVVGRGTVGANACISPGSTLIDPQVDSGVLLPPNTLLGAAAPAAKADYGNAYQPANQNPNPNGFSASGANQNRADSNGFGSNGSSSSGFNSSGFNSSFVPDISTQPLPKTTFVEPEPIGTKPVQIPSIDVNAPAASYASSNNGVQLNQPYKDPSYHNQSYSPSSNGNQSSALTAPAYDRVYGREQVSELISTLFPNRHLTNGN